MPDDITVADQVTNAVSKKIIGWLAGILATGLIALTSASVAFFATVRADAARNEEVHRSMQRGLAEVESDVGEHEHSNMSEDIAVLRSKTTSMDNRLQSMQKLLDERLPLRRGRR